MPELEFSRVDRPLLSIVMLTRDDREWAPRALKAVLDHTEPCYEVIVVDNGSEDGTREFLTDRVSGITSLLNDRNYGFGVSNNLGASHARGRYVLFLNSDVFVHADWLPPLLSILEQDETVAAVGPRILNLDGSLQLAGALLTRAGATVAYGNGDDPSRQEYAFSREVDYCSGGCLVVRRSAFVRVGGFDPAFGLIYFEDADFCLSLWEIGLRTVYEPRSTVTHVGGGGAEPRPGVLLSALRNRSIFERRWRSLLVRYPLAPPSSPRRLVAARDARASTRLLVVDDTDSAKRLAAAFPSACITLVGGDEAVSSIEHAKDLESVLRERRFHFDAVVSTAATIESMRNKIAETQPQAAVLPIESIPLEISRAQSSVRALAGESAPEAQLSRSESR